MKKIGFLVLFAAIFSLYTLSSHSMPSRAVGEQIEEVYEVTIEEELEKAQINAIFDIFKIKLNDEIFNTTELRENYIQLKAHLTRAINATLHKRINTAFPHAMGTYGNVSVTNTSLHQQNAKKPVKAMQNATLTYSCSSFGFEKDVNLADILRGVLKMGGKVTKDLRVEVEPGHNIKFNIKAPKNYTLENASWSVTNVNGTYLENATKHLTIAHTRPNSIEAEKILIDTTLDMQDFDKLYLKGTLSIKSISIKKYNVSLPAQIKNLTYISSDGLRLALGNGLVKWRDVENETNKSVNEIAEKLSHAFNVSVNFTFRWNESTKEGYDVNRMGDERPIKGNFSFRCITLSMGEWNATSIRGFLNAGARVTIEVPFTSRSYNTTFILPKQMNFTTEAEYKGKVNGRNSYFFDSAKKFSFVLRSDIAPNYTSNRASLQILVDFQDVDLLGLQIPIDFQCEIKIYHMKCDTKENLPENVSLEYLNSDCIRLAVDVGVVSIHNITKEIEEAIREKLSSMINVSVKMKVYADEASFKGYNVTMMSDERPVKIFCEGTINIPLREHFSLFGFTKKFEFVGVKGFNTTYKIIFPEGMEITNIEDDFGWAKKGHLHRRSYFQVELLGGERDTVTITIDFSTYILLRTMPFIILSAVILALGVGIRYWLRKEEKI